MAQALDLGPHLARVEARGLQLALDVAARARRPGARRPARRSTGWPRPRAGAPRRGSGCRRRGMTCAVVAVLHREVGAEQVVVHDHDVGLERALAHARHPAGVEVGAGLADAVLARGRDLAPEVDGVGQVGDLARGRRSRSRAPRPRPRGRAGSRPAGGSCPAWPKERSAAGKGSSPGPSSPRRSGRGRAPGPGAGCPWRRAAPGGSWCRWRSRPGGPARPRAGGTRGSCRCRCRPRRAAGRRRVERLAPRPRTAAAATAAPRSPGATRARRRAARARRSSRPASRGRERRALGRRRRGARRRGGSVAQLARRADLGERRSRCRPLQGPRDEPADLFHLLRAHAARGEGRRADADAEATIGGFVSKGIVFLLTVMPAWSSAFSADLAGEARERTRRPASGGCRCRRRRGGSPRRAARRRAPWRWRRPAAGRP